MTHDTCLQAHLARFFDGHDVTYARWDRGPISATIPGFSVAVVSPGPRIGVWTYCSLGASRVLRPQTEPLEFAIAADSRDDRQVELVTMTAHYHATIGLAIGDTFPLGEAWLPGSQLTHMLVSLPYPYGPTFENCNCEGSDIRFLWLLPITGSELQYKKTHGLEALEAKFDEHSLGFWDSNRASVV